MINGTDLTDVFVIFVGQMCVFVSRPKLSLFFGKTITPQNWLLIFPGKGTHSENKSWKSSMKTTKVNKKSSRILRVKPNFFIFSLFIIFLSFFRFFHFFHFFHFFISFISFIFSFFHFFHFFIFSFFLFSCSFIFFHFLTCSFHFLFIFCSGLKNLFFFGPQFRYDFSSHIFKRINFSARLGRYRFEASFPFFFLLFFPPFSFSLFSVCFFFKKNVFLYLFFFFSIILYQGLTKEHRTRDCLIAKLKQNMYPQSSQALRPEQTQHLQKNPIHCTPTATPKHRTRDCQIRGHKEIKHHIPKCGQREQRLGQTFF